MNEAKITEYVIAKISEIEKEIEEAKKQIEEQEEFLKWQQQKEEERLEEAKQNMADLGFEDKEIDYQILSMYDAFSNSTIDDYYELEKMKKHLTELENDLIVFENYGR